MELSINLEALKVIEFGVGRDEEDGQTFLSVPTDGGVKGALREMVRSTWERMVDLSPEPEKYEPSEKYASVEHLYLSMDSPLVQSLRYLYEAAQLEIDSDALASPANIFCYFVRVTDIDGQRLTALRRSTHFKGILKSRLLRLASDTLKLVGEQTFKLDNDFDVLMDSRRVHILRASGFEFAGRLQDAILKSVTTNIGSIQDLLPFVDFDVVGQYASQHPRAARYLASISSSGSAVNIDREALKTLCANTRVSIREADGLIKVEEGQVLGFLEVLDRRRYQIELVEGQPESFKAASRKLIRA